MSSVSPAESPISTPLSRPPSPWRLTVAPMMDWTDRHCRAFHRLISPNARLYTEMVTTGALLHGDVPRHLDFNGSEHPVALQLGGSEPADLAQCARLGAQWGYDEINLNCGCPSERVQRGAFGACLMAEPLLVRDCVKAMVDAVDIPVTVKHRIGIDKTESYDFVRDFVGTVAEGGCTVFIVHARNAWLKGLSPKENREIPPLRYDFARRLKQDFPQLTIVLNGGLKTVGDVQGATLPQDGLPALDGVMIGREAYHNPWVLREMDNALFSPGTAEPVEAVSSADGASPVQGALDTSLLARMATWGQLMDYIIERRAADGTHPFAITRHALGLFQGLSGARVWRRTLSDPRLLGKLSDEELRALPLPRVTQRLAA
ncbi:MAG TPA: tRNA dihydrouridine(20/20a) synthase DusA [Burkholderiaceae bacterium]|nr:tRNA dihydrouridine(20/20a) synthase DusA [Burkholderiaceae bacterium]